MKNILLILITFYSNLTFSQIATFEYSGGNLNTNKIEVGEKLKKIEGSKYYNEDFIIAKIENFDKNVEIRFNAFDNNFEIRNAGNTVILDSYYKKIEFANGESFELIEYKNSKKKFNSKYLKKINHNLYELINYKFIQGTVANNSYKETKQSKYIKIKSSYIVKYKSEFIEIPSNIKNLEILFPDKVNDLKSFIKTNKIKLDKEESLIKLAQFLNS